MPQRKQVSWTELRVGIFVLVALFVIAVAIFYVTGGRMLTAKYRLHTFLPEVAGLTTGAPVRLDGVDIGNVDKIIIATYQPGQKPNPDRNIEIEMSIDKRYRDYIRSDSTASLITEGLLGNRYVNVDRGVTGAVLPDNAEVPGKPEKDVQLVVQRSADLLANLNVLSADARDLIDGLHEGRGTLGKLLTDDQAYNHLNALLAKSEQMVDYVQSGNGSLGKIYASDELYSKLDSATGHVDTILADIQAQKGTFGKLIYDPTLHNNANAAFQKINLTLDDARAGKGTLGKLMTDDTLFAKFKEVGSNLSEATAKLNGDRTTAGKFFSDPQLYDNLTGLAGDLRLFVGDFRQNPKKFLRVKFSIF